MYLIFTCRFLDELGASCQHEGGDDHLSDPIGLLAVPTVTTNDLTPNSSPSSSPAIQRRARHASISDPLTAIKLEVEGLCRKVQYTLSSNHTLLNCPSLRWMNWWIFYKANYWSVL